MFLQLEDEQEPTPEVENHCIGADILLPRGDKRARGHVVARIHNANGNYMNRTHRYPILDTKMY